MFTQDLDASVWHMIAFSAGTGGSLLIIGSAAGVVVMGLEQISFGWYIKRIAPLAFAGFLAGFLTLLFIF
jgi:Na+/H+ antiporter NhaD/arsenite permease-like protein